MRQRMLQQLGALHSHAAPLGAPAAHDIVAKARGRTDSFVRAGVQNLVPQKDIDLALLRFAALLANRSPNLRMCHYDFTHQNIVSRRQDGLYFMNWDFPGPGHPFEEIAQMMLYVDLPRAEITNVL